MSANNYLLIEKIDGKYRLSDIDADGSGGFFISDDLFDSLEEAVKAANEYMKTEPVEYGLRIKI